MGIERVISTSELEFQGQSVLQVTRWTGKRVAVTTTVASQRLTLPVGSECTEITAEKNVFVNFGDNAVDASSTIANDESRFFLAGVQVVPVPVGATHIAVIWQTEAGIFQVEQVK